VIFPPLAAPTILRLDALDPRRLDRYRSEGLYPDRSPDSRYLRVPRGVGPCCRLSSLTERRCQLLRSRSATTVPGGLASRSRPRRRHRREIDARVRRSVRSRQTPCWPVWDRPGPAAAGTDPTTAPWPRTCQSPRKAAASRARALFRRRRARSVARSPKPGRSRRCAADHRHVARQSVATAAAAAADTAPNGNRHPGNRRGRDARSRRRNRGPS